MSSDTSDRPKTLLADQIERDMTLYGVSINAYRAIPYIDGLKPVQRRILYAMHQMHLVPTAPHKKSARVVGEVLGKYHPHGDQSVYDAMVRMAQPWAMRYPLVDGQGNFGSQGGASPAAMRYTESRLAPIADQIFADLSPDTVMWRDNFDGSEREPTLIPTRIPLILCMGISGIGLGMSTNIPPHNLREVGDAIAYVCKHWDSRHEISLDKLMKFIPGPDFPSGGILYRYRDERGEPVDQIRALYESGQGKPILDGRLKVEAIGGGKHNIVVSELPYQSTAGAIVAKLISKIKEAAIEGVADLRDETDYRGLRIVVESVRGADPQKIVQDILNHTDVRTTFAGNMVAVPSHKSPPTLMGLRDLLIGFIDHRLEVIRLRSESDREKLAARLHIIEGLLAILVDIDKAIEIIRKSKDRADARANLIKHFDLSADQAQAVVTLQLGSLANMEQIALKEEQKELQEKIAHLTVLIESESARLDVVGSETKEACRLYGDDRRTTIVDDEGKLPANTVLLASDVEEEKAVHIVGGEVKMLKRVAYKSATTAVWLWLPSTMSYFATASGMVSILPISQAGAYSNPDGTLVISGGTVHEADGSKMICLTEAGKIKVVELTDLPVGRAGWHTLIGLADGDRLAYAGMIPAPNWHALIFTSDGQALRVDLETIRPQASSTATGVAGIALGEGARIVGCSLVAPDYEGSCLIASENGFVKRTAVAEFPVKGRGSKGVACLRVTPATGDVAVATVIAADTKDIIAINDDSMEKLSVAAIPLVARAPRGDKLLNQRANSLLSV